MKHPSHVGWLLMTVAVLLVAGCFTGREISTPLREEPADDLDASIDAILNDKSTWYDPVNPF